MVLPSQIIFVSVLSLYYGNTLFSGHVLLQYNIIFSLWSTMVYIYTI